ncbi:MAG: hypothetical protein Q7R58_02000 [bacterium]|nr:hypothetical protein [bacterium]
MTDFLLSVTGYMVALILFLGAVLMTIKYMKRAGSSPPGGNGGASKAVRNALVALGVVVILLLIWRLWLTQGQSLESPSAGEVWGWTKTYWHWVALALAIPFVGLFWWSEKPWAKGLQWSLVAVAAVLFIVCPIIVQFDDDEDPRGATRSAEIPLASSPQSEWPKLVIPAGGRSERVTSPPGMHLVMSGNNFLLHAVYPDGHECSFGQSCPNASEIINYATNEAKETNIVSYAFAPN